MVDHELERFKRDINLIEYAKKAGFEPSRGQGGHGLTFLEHPNRDAIVVAQNQGGQWICASLSDCPPRAPGESPERAEERVRASIARTRDKGSIIEFVQHRDCTARTGEVGVELVRGRLRDFQESGVSLDSYGPLRLPIRFGGHPRDAAPGADGVGMADKTRSPSETAVERSAGGDVQSKHALNRRLGDWSPAPLGTSDVDVQERLRLWQGAQRGIDEKLGRREGQPATERGFDRAADKLLPKNGGPLERSSDSGEHSKSALARRRYDWTPAGGDGSLARSPRNRGPDRGR